MKKIIFTLLISLSLTCQAGESLSPNEKAGVTASILAFGAIVSAPAGLTVVVAGLVIAIDSKCQSCKPSRRKHFRK